MEIIEVSEKEIIQIKNLAKIIWEEHYTSIIGSQQVAYMLDRYQSEEAIREQIEQGYTYYLFVEEGSAIGYCAILYGKDASFLSKIYVLKQFRGHGYAAKAMQFMEKKCKEIQSAYIWLKCNIDNSNSLKQYDKLGFHIFDSGITDIGDGYVMDDYFLKKDLI